MTQTTTECALYARRTVDEWLLSAPPCEFRSLELEHSRTKIETSVLLFVSVVNRDQVAKCTGGNEEEAYALAAKWCREHP